MKSSIPFVWLLVPLATASCGGKVIFDGGSGGATVGSVTSTGTTKPTSATVGSTGSSVDCQSLKTAMQNAIAAAAVCSPQSQMIQCSGAVVVNDQCGCPNIILNETQPAKVTAAKNAYAAWTKAGCGPQACGALCMPAQGGACLPQNGSGGGTCEGVTPAG
jgi:hypothetical protein